MSLLRQLLSGAGLLAALAAWYVFTQHQLAQARAEVIRAASRADGLSAQLEAAKQDTRIVTRYVDRVRTVHERGATIVQKVPVYVPRAVVSACTVNRGFVRVLNAAASSTDLPATATLADATAAGVGLDTVAGSVVGNYTTCHATAAQLTALQAWVRAHSSPVSPRSTGPP